VRWWASAFFVWTLLALLSASQAAVFMSNAGRPFGWGPLLGATFLDWYTCAAFTPVFVWLVRHYPIDRQNWMRVVPLMFVVTSVCVVVKYAVYGPLHIWLFPGQGTFGLGELLARSFFTESIAFWSTLGVLHAVEFYRKYREHEVQTLRLQAQLAEARLESLTAQLQPHFLFNTLNGVATLMHRDIEAADMMLTRLSDLLRLTLRDADRPEVPLGEELDLLSRYLDILRLRFPDRLSVETRISASAASALVPRFVLQPLVENAVQHGISRRAGAGRIQITADRSGDTLHLSVTDDGAGMRGDAEFPREGIGLSNTRRRLTELYGDAQRLTLDRLDGSGLRVALSIPYRESPAPAAA
jgi:two-component system LytT family sensor kinase